MGNSCSFRDNCSFRTIMWTVEEWKLGRVMIDGISVVKRCYWFVIHILCEP